MVADLQKVVVGLERVVASLVVADSEKLLVTFVVVGLEKGVAGLEMTVLVLAGLEITSFVVTGLVVAELDRVVAGLAVADSEKVVGSLMLAECITCECHRTFRSLCAQALHRRLSNVLLDPQSEGHNRPISVAAFNDFEPSKWKACHLKLVETT